MVQVNQIENGVSEVKIKYVYDGLGRLIQEQNAFMDKSSIYSYDNAGNITLKVEYCYNEYSPFDDSDYIQTTQYSYTNGRLNNVVVFDDYESEQSSCAYDEIGNPTNYLGRVATWSHGHRLDNFGGAHFTYNTSGLRTRKAINGVETKYLLNGTDIVCQQSSNGKTFKFYYGIDGVTAFDYNGDKYYYKKNIFGDIIGIYDSDNSFVAGYAYDAFGNFRFIDELGGDIYIIPEVAQLNPFRYRSYYYDENHKCGGANVHTLKQHILDFHKAKAPDEQWKVIFFPPDGLAINSLIESFRWALLNFVQNVFIYVDEVWIFNTDSTDEKSYWDSWFTQGEFLFLMSIQRGMPNHMPKVYLYNPHTGISTELKSLPTIPDKEYRELSLLEANSDILWGDYAALRNVILFLDKKV